MKAIKYGLLALSFAAAWVLTGCSVEVSGSIADNCKFQQARSATIAVDDAKTLSVIARAGSLRVEGRPGLNEVRVQGTACATSENLVNRVDLRAEKVGDVVRVEAILPSVSFGNSPMLDLIIEVPETMAARIDDTSGEIEVRRIAGVEVEDDSGSMDLTEIAGPVRISDDSGDIDVRDVTGNVVVKDDGSGGMRIDGVKGDVQIDQDGSGDIDITDVTGSVTIDEDGSGSIDVDEIQGDFTVRRDGSGDIHYRNVAGRTAIPKD